MPAIVTPSAESFAAAAPKDSPPPSVRLEAGGLLFDRYRVEAVLSGHASGELFAARRLADGAAVVVRRLAPKQDTRARQEAWKRLTQEKVPAVLELLESFPTAEGRVEIRRAPESPLTEWLALQAMEPTAVLTVVRLLARALLALHERGVVYLRLCPENVFLTGDGLDSVVLGAPEECAVIGQEGTIPVPVDLTRVPPEGFDLTELKAGEGLKAWDWWTLGRFAQELVLGQPMMIHLIGRAVPRTSPEVRRQAEALLKESDPTGTRAGAVELMPDIPPDLTLFLRGVLTTPREGRWGAGEIKAWLDGKRPSDRYDLPAGSQFVKVGEETLTLPEAAERLGRDAYWALATEQFKAEEPPEGTPAQVLLGTATSFTNEREWYLKVREMRDASAFQNFALDARTEALAALAWTGVAPAGTKLRWRGRTVDAELMRDLIQDDAGLARAKVLCARTFADMLQPRDATLAWSLRTWGHEWDEAESLALKHRWLRFADSRRKLATYVFRGGEARNQALQAGREKFHLTSLEPLQALFGAANPSSAQLIVLAYTLERPNDFGYITHHKWMLMEQDRLRGRAEALSRGIQGLRTAQAVRVGFPVFGGTGPWWGAAAALLLVVGLLWPGVPAALLTLGLIAIAALIRLQLGGTMRALAPAPEGERWRWSVILPSLQAAAQRAAGAGVVPRVNDLRAELGRVNKELTTLPLTPVPAPVALGPRPFGLWTTAVSAWAVVSVLLGLCGWQAARAPWTPDHVATSWNSDLQKIEEAWASSTMPDLSFNMGAPKPAWSFVPSGVVHPVNILDRFQAEERHLVVMKSFLVSLQEHYQPKTLKGLLATEVPTADGLGGGLMVLDLDTGKLASPVIFRVEQMPVRGMTIELDGLQALYLNGP